MYALENTVTFSEFPASTDLAVPNAAATGTFSPSPELSNVKTLPLDTCLKRKDRQTSFDFPQDAITLRNVLLKTLVRFREILLPAQHVDTPETNELKALTSNLELRLLKISSEMSDSEIWDRPVKENVPLIQDLSSEAPSSAGMLQARKRIQEAFKQKLSGLPPSFKLSTPLFLETPETRLIESCRSNLKFTFLFYAAMQYLSSSGALPNDKLGFEFFAVILRQSLLIPRVISESEGSKIFEEFAENGYLSITRFSLAIARISQALSRPPNNVKYYHEMKLWGMMRLSSKSYQEDLFSVFRSRRVLISLQEFQFSSSGFPSKTPMGPSQSPAPTSVAADEEHSESAENADYDAAGDPESEGSAFGESEDEPIDGDVSANGANNDIFVT